MHTDGSQFWTILNWLRHACRKSAYVRLAALADQFQRTVLDNITGCRRHIEYLTSLRHTGFVVRQRVVTTIALRWQWVVHGAGRLLDLLKGGAFVPGVRAGLLTCPLTNRRRSCPPHAAQ